MRLNAHSAAAEGDWKYPKPSAPLREHRVRVCDDPLHTLYVHEYGNLKGEPVLFLHGGPGGATVPTYAQFFDPKRYHIILFDQRGCGKSVPNAAEDPAAALQRNTTADLIADINKVREACGVEGKMHLFGGSWGATLALAYAIEHPQNLASLTLRGTRLMRRRDNDYFYQGNAATYDQHPQYDPQHPGAYMFYPEAWKAFVDVIPQTKRGDMVKAYAEIFQSVPKDQAEQSLQDRAAIAWSTWEGVTSWLSCAKEDVAKFAEPEFAKAFAKTENHYILNGGFLGGRSGEANRDNNYILENIQRASAGKFPTFVVHGQFDQVCPSYQSRELVAEMQKHGMEVHAFFPPCGHSQLEQGNMELLTQIMDTMPTIPLHQHAASTVTGNAAGHGDSQIPTKGPT